MQERAKAIVKAMLNLVEDPNNRGSREYFLHIAEVVLIIIGVLPCDFNYNKKTFEKKTWFFGKRTVVEDDYDFIKRTAEEWLKSVDNEAPKV